MISEAGSDLLNTSAVAAHINDRGPLFQLVDPIATRTATFSSPHGSFSSLERSDIVSFVLRPPTLQRKYHSSLNEAVHLEWLKGRGAGWVSGSPRLHYSKENGCFQIIVKDLSSHIPDPSHDFITQSSLIFALDTIEDAALDECISIHLTEGGDDRLHLSEDGVNKYFCPPRPLPENVIIRSSCTCSSPTKDGFEACRLLLRKLWDEKTTCSFTMEGIRQSFSSVLGIYVPHKVILHPSGSDAELVPLITASIRAKEMGCSNIVNIVAAAGEVGSGTAAAACGRHFSSFTPCGSVVKNGTILGGFPNSTQVIEIKPRDVYGNFINNYDALVSKAIDESLKAHENPYFVLHAVDGSKTGLRLPSRDLLEDLTARMGERLLVVLDACQCRSEPEELNWFLDRGSIVLVTGSKFYSAPGFCGAVLIPSKSAHILGSYQSPAGLSDYLTKSEVPSSFKTFRSSLPNGPQNFGLLLRWACGITEMDLFFKMGYQGKRAIHDWVSGVRQMVRKRRPALDLIDTDFEESARDQTRSGGVNSVVSIKFLRKCGTSHFDVPLLKSIHLFLTIDASNMLPSRASEADRTIASLRCMVGQPVQLGCFGVLRLAIGAPMAREIASKSGCLERALKQDEQILKKMLVLSKYCEEMLSIQ